MTSSASQHSLNLLTQAVWKANGHEGFCPLERHPTFRQLDDLITTTAWGWEAREEFFQRWQVVEGATDNTYEVGSFAELAHLVWEDVSEKKTKLKHPLAPLIAAWQSGPLEVQAVRDVDGSLRSDTIAPRIAMRDSGNAKADRLYLTPAHIAADSEGVMITLPGFEDGRNTGRIPTLPVNLYDLGVTAGEARGGVGQPQLRPACWSSSHLRRPHRFGTGSASLHTRLH